MRRLLALLVLACLPLSTLAAAPDDLLYSRFERYLEALRAQAGIPGMVATIVGDSDVVWERTFGYQNQERSVGMLADTPFHLDQLTQIVTATLVLQCAERGVVDLDTPIGNFESDSSEPGSTVRQRRAPSAIAVSRLLPPTRLATRRLAGSWRPSRRAWPSRPASWRCNSTLSRSRTRPGLAAPTLLPTAPPTQSRCSRPRSPLARDCRRRKTR